MTILKSFDTSFFKMESFRLYEEFFPDDLVDLLHR